MDIVALFYDLDKFAATANAQYRRFDKHRVL